MTTSNYLQNKPNGNASVCAFEFHRTKLEGLAKDGLGFYTYIYDELVGEVDGYIRMNLQ